MMPVTRPASSSGFGRGHLVGCSSQVGGHYAAGSVGQEMPQVFGTEPGHSVEGVLFSESGAWA